MRHRSSTACQLSHAHRCPASAFRRRPSRGHLAKDAQQVGRLVGAEVGIEGCQAPTYAPAGHRTDPDGPPAAHAQPRRRRWLDGPRPSRQVVVDTSRQTLRADSPSPPPRVRAVAWFGCPTTGQTTSFPDDGRGPASRFSCSGKEIVAIPTIRPCFRAAREDRHDLQSHHSPFSEVSGLERLGPGPLGRAKPCLNVHNRYS